MAEGSFRAPLDLTDVLSDYTEWFGEIEGYVSAKKAALPSISSIDLTPKVSYVPGLARTCSSCTDLDVSPRIIWDVNGYYRDFGVDPRATRKELREAYHRIGAEHSAYLTYVFKQLIDPDVRRAYDCMPLGEVYVDEYVSNALKDRARAEALRRNGGRPMEQGDIKSRTEEVMAEMGYDLVDEGSVGPHPYSDHMVGDWGWGYYLDDVICHDEAALAKWQQMLVSVLSSRGDTKRFAVGFTRQDDTRPKSFTRTEADGIMVFYLGALTEPTAILADALTNITTITTTTT